LEILESSCPYRWASDEGNTLELRYQQKKEKYPSLAEELKKYE
jgi:hypothetical protein